MSRWVVLLGLLPLMLIAQEPPKVRVENPLTSTLEEGLKFVSQERWVDAVELFQRMIDTSGDELMPIDRYQWHRVRWVVQREIAKLPPLGLATYRKRVDSPAQKRLDEAKKNRDFDLLRSLVKDWFASRPTEQAISLLAEEAFLRGDFSVAERYWKMLHRPVSLQNIAITSEFIYPSPQSDPAAIRARLILVQLFREELRQAETELKRFREAHPDAGGYLAGKQGKYAEILEEILRTPAMRVLPFARKGESAWPTLGGDLSRESLSEPLNPQLLSDYPTWRVEIPVGPPPAIRKRGAFDDYPSQNREHPRSLAFHPIAWRDQLLYCDTSRIWAVEARTGRFSELFQTQEGPSTVFDLQKHLKFTIFDATLPSRLDVRYSLTLAEGMIFFRGGTQRFIHPNPDARDEHRETESAIACLAPKVDKKSILELKWLLKPTQDKPESPLIFEGTPLVQDDQLFVGVTRMQGGESVGYVACYEGLHGSSPPRLRWIREVGKSSIQSGLPRSRAEYLALADGSLFYLTPAGTLYSLDPKTGKPNWEFRYPKRDRDRPREAVSGRDGSPLLVSNGRCFVAPSEAEKIFALDSFSGRLLWESRHLEAIQLLGVSRGKLICTLDRPMRGICGLDLETGTDRFPDGWLQHDGEGEATFGRGLISGDTILWPTKSGLHFLNGEDGSPVRQPIVPRDFYGAIEPLGNLLQTEIGLFVATPTEIWGYVTEKRSLPPIVQPKPQEGKKATPVARSQNWRERLPEKLPLSVPMKRTQFQPSDDAEKVFRGDTQTIHCWRNRVECREGEELRWALLQSEFTHRESESNRFHGFRLVGDLLLLLLNENRLLAVDLNTGRLRWSQWAVSSRALLGPNRIVFREMFYADSSHLLIQLSSGTIRVIETATGSIIKELPGSPLPWLSPPAQVAKGQVVFAREQNLLVRFDLASASTVWTYSIPRFGSFAGKLPEVRRIGRDLLLGVHRNHGTEIDRIDAEAGVSLWSSPTLIPGETTSLADLAVQENRFHLTTENALCCFAGSTGHRLWRKPLDLSHGKKWRVFSLDQGLLLAPQFADRLRIVLPSLVELSPWLWVEAGRNSYHAWKDRTASLLLVEEQNGELLQRIPLAVNSESPVELSVNNGSLLVRTGRAEYQFQAE
jgi:outer membrane protein assembly factor BamB